MYQSKKVKVGDRVRIIDRNQASVNIGDTGVVRRMGVYTFQVVMDTTEDDWFFADEHVELVDQPVIEKFTLQQCRDQFICIKVENEEDFDTLCKECVKAFDNPESLRGLIWDKCNDVWYIRVYNRNNNSNWDTFGKSSTTYTQGFHLLAEYKADKEINFSQLIFDTIPMEAPEIENDYTKPFIITGKSHHIQAIYKDLEKLRFNLSTSILNDRTIVLSPNHHVDTNSKSTYLELYAGDNLNDAIKHHRDKGVVFNLPQQWHEALTFAEKQLKFLTPESITFGRDIVITHVANDKVKVVVDSMFANHFDKKEMIEILESKFTDAFGYQITEIKIGCTRFDRKDYDKVMEFLK